MILEELLSALNRIRKESGASVLSELPAGERNNGNNCVVAVALKDIDPGIKVYKEGIFSTDKNFSQLVADQLEYGFELIVWKLPTDYRYGVPTPIYMRNFIADFDEGKFPELEAS